MIKKLILFLCLVSIIYADADDYNATQNADDLGIYYQDYNFLMGLNGTLVGFIVLGFFLYSIVQITKK